MFMVFMCITVLICRRVVSYGNLRVVSLVTHVCENIDASKGELKDVFCTWTVDVIGNKSLTSRF